MGQVNEGEEVGGFSARWLAKNRDYTQYKKAPTFAVG
jgi:hypothetical protein